MPTKHGARVDRFYHSAQWQSARDYVIAKNHGRCEICGKAAKTVHHKIPLNEFNVDDPQVSLNPKNLQLVCPACHREIHGDIETGFAEKPTVTLFDRNGNVIVVDKKQGEGESGNVRRKQKD